MDLTLIQLIVVSVVVGVLVWLMDAYLPMDAGVKRTASQDDSDALLYLRSDTGLQRINGAAPVSAANGTLTNTATSFTGNVAISETAGVTARSNYVWWLKGFDTTPDPDEGFTLATGKFTIACWIAGDSVKELT